MITRHVHNTVTFGFDEWADDEEITYADTLADEPSDESDDELDEDDEDVS